MALVFPPFTTSQAERLFNFDFGFVTDHFESFSIFLFFGGTSFSSVPVSLVRCLSSYCVDLNQHCRNQEY